MGLERYGDVAPGAYDPRNWIKDANLLDSAVHAPQASMGGDFLYKDLYEMAVAYWVGLACNHGFQNGNKRVALASCSTFLRMNGLKME